jgi:hypothetical protein
MKLPDNDDPTGLPWPRSWAGVYGLVLVVFLAWVGLLAALAGVFS